MGVYLDTNVFYNVYCPVENNKPADWLLNQLSAKFTGITCEWTILEMFRALKKQVNLEKISEKDAGITLDFFLADIGEMIEQKALTMVSITRSAIVASRKQIFDRNLYAADALHASIALSSQAQYFITFDQDFRGNLENIPVLNPEDSEFRNQIKRIKNRDQAR